MKGKNFSVNIQRAKYIVTDYVMVSLAFFLFNIIRFYVLVSHESVFYDVWQYLGTGKMILEQTLMPLALLGLFWFSGYYNHPFRKSRVNELDTTLWSAIVATALIYLIFLINDKTGFKSRDYKLILVLFGLLFGFTYLGRIVLTNLTLKRLKKRKWIYSTLIVGNSGRSREIYRKLKENGSVWAYNVVGFVKIDGETGIQDDLPVWDWKEVEKVCREKNVDQIILAPDRIRDLQIMKLLARLFPLNIPVKIAPDTLSFITANIHISDILGVPLVDLTSPRMSDYQANVKRAFDVVFSALALCLLSPLLIAIGICVKVGSKGPVIYRQERIGKGRKPFFIYKFRTMDANSEPDGPQLSRENDPRITSVGNVLRKYRLDELPQFWNVLKGEMSLVGPRPEREYYIQKIISKAPYYGLIFQVRPGITSWGMVQFGYASDVREMVKRSRYDLLYLNNMSLSTDIKILIHTVVTVAKGSGK